MDALIKTCEDELRRRRQQNPRLKGFELDTEITELIADDINPVSIAIPTNGALVLHSAYWVNDPAAAYYPGTGTSDRVTLFDGPRSNQAKKVVRLYFAENGQDIPYLFTDTRVYTVLPNNLFANGVRVVFRFYKVTFYS